jgi:hypothetical protein
MLHYNDDFLRAFHSAVSRNIYFILRLLPWKFLCIPYYDRTITAKMQPVKGTAALLIPCLLCQWRIKQKITLSDGIFLLINL